MSEGQGKYNILKVLSGKKLWFRHDEESGGIIASDQGGYITTRKEFEDLSAGLEKFFDVCSDEEIEQYNAEADRRREERSHNEKIKTGRKAAKGFVYLIRAENGLYKIGKAKNVSTRMQPFSVSFPMKWELVHSFMSDDYSNAEEWLHQAFSKKRDVGEWFKLSPEDVEYIKAIKDGGL